MQIRLSQAAETDLLQGFNFYERQQLGLGAYFLNSLSSDIDSLMLYAGVHPKLTERFYRMLAKRFPFAIYYELTADIATIVAVLDCRQNPISTHNRLV
ncbi:MAG: type II toxin-antitoxin system RelE/ParE family toxin [Methylococcaceae bacterium]|jgi:plasmid stabilization system protein ParE|nr:type II toxin-antitoxin system RelE/ParE family toxin [Methylococcaceae bacterium]MDZ4156573.1 type II toxin-antitoxin system RelE/ParE family toxin [Methylococcales bacterium]MDP2394723.1 type II toxin-antitoxin system RelE/ParE family toxin [Methylococcaceae bacterium]MDP3020145.1 type II toxin-antitoxin system RelE/ParE family toxin [Methylococcaceae bacterium]MDP3390685.1 type II toxin-antitoxin system RelE/ParE family toxin [Methylococcaceae bacterium]